MESYDLLTKMKRDKKTQADIDTQTSKVSWIFLQCMKALFLIGHYNLLAMHFCGSVCPDLMLENAAFHGFNERCAISYSLDEHLCTYSEELVVIHGICLCYWFECRTLSLGKGMELVEDISQTFRGFGLEAILLMFQKTCQTYLDAIHADSTPACASKVHTPQELMQCFITKQYVNKVYVPGMFSPACGQVSSATFLVFGEHQLLIQNEVVVRMFVLWAYSIAVLPTSPSMMNWDLRISKPK